MMKKLETYLLTACLILFLIAFNGCAKASATQANGMKTSHVRSAATTLYLLGYDVPMNEREKVVSADIEILNKNLRRHAAVKSFDEMLNMKSLEYQRDTYDSVRISDLTLCDYTGTVKCLKDIQSNPTPFRQSLAKLSLAMSNIDTLRKHSGHELASVFPDRLRSAQEPISGYQYFLKPLTTQSALAYYDNPITGLKTVCDNISFSKKLIQSDDNLIQTFMGVGLLKNNLEILEHTTESLPYSCAEALQPMATKDILICPLVNSEALQLKNLLLNLDQTPILFSHKASIKLIDKDIQLFCNNEWSSKVSNDEMTSSPMKDLKLNKLFNRTGSILVNIARADYSSYQNRLLDANASLRLWQAAIDPQCQNAVNNPKVLNRLFMGKYSSVNTELFNYLNTLLNDLNRVRALRVDNQKRLSIVAYDQSNNTIKSSKVNTVDDLSHISVSCRTVK